MLKLNCTYFSQIAFWLKKKKVMIELYLSSKSFNSFPFPLIDLGVRTNNDFNHWLSYKLVFVSI